MVRTARAFSRQFFAALTSLLLVLFWVPGLVGTAHASGTTLPSSGTGAFEAGDGDMAPGGALDWGSSSIQSTLANQADSHTSCGSNDDIFSSTQEDDTLVNVVCQSSPGKVDLSRIYAWSQTVGTDTYLYLAWEAPNQAGGNNNHIDFELNQLQQPNLDPTGSNVTPAQTGVYQLNRKANDRLFDFDLTTSTPSIEYSTWKTANGDTCDTGKTIGTPSGPSACWSPKTTLTSNAIAAIYSGTSTFIDPVLGGSIGNGGFGEMGIDLTAAGIFTGTTCTDFTGFWAKGRSSGSGGTSEMKDYVPPSSVSVSNCMPLSILKEGPNGEKLAGAHFDITADSGTSPVPSGQGSCVTRSDGYCYIKVSSNPDVYAKPMVFPGQYHVQETQAPDGYFKASPDTLPVTVPQTTADPDLIFTDGLGSVTFSKVDADNNNAALAGATFEIKATGRAAKDTFHYDELVTDGGSASADGTYVKDESTTPGTIRVKNLPIGDYQITETAPPNNWYTLDSSVKTFSIDEGTTLQENPVVSSAFADHHVLSKLVVEKTTADGDKSGAHFSLYNGDPNNGGTFVNSCVTGNGSVTDSNGTVDGECAVGQLDWGHTYYWKETQPPSGYNLPDVTVLPANGILIPGPGGTDTSLPSSFPVTDFVDTTSALRTAATQDGVAGTTAISDSATLTGVRQTAGGTITFSAFANDSGCSTTPEYTNTVNVSGPNTYNSGSFTPTMAGTYYWLVTYSGDKDASNNVLDVGATDTCGNMSNDNVERSPVANHSLSLTTVAGDTHTVDGYVSDTATFGDLIADAGATPPFVAPTGTVTFTLYESCGGPERGHVTVPVTYDSALGKFVANSGTVAGSGTFQADNNHAGGHYYWAASYTPGTNDNYSSFTEDCGGANETSSAPVLDAPAKSNNPTGSVSIYKNNNQITYTLTVHNSGAAEMDGVTVTDSKFSNLATYNANSIGCDSFALNCKTDDSDPTNLKWTFDLAAGQTATLTFSVTVKSSDADTAVIDNTAHVTNGNTGIDTNTVHNPVDYPILSINKCASPAPQSIPAGTNASCTTDPSGSVAPGSTIAYSLTVHNAGDQDAAGVTVQDAIPAGTALVPGSASCDNGDNTCSVQAGTVNGVPGLVWTGVAVGAGKDVVLTFSATVADQSQLTNGQKIDNSGSFGWSNSGATTPDEAGTSATVEHVVKFPILALSKTADPASGSIVQRGDTITYTLTVANSGLAAGPAVVTDTLPANVTLVGGSASPAPTSVSGKTLTWNVTVPAQGTSVITYKVTVDQDAPEGSTQTNVALIGGQCVGNADASRCTTDHHVPTGALTLVKAVDKTTANYGDTLTYKFTAATTGALDQTAVTVTDVVPTGTSYVAGSAACTDAGPCTTSYNAATKTVTWQLGDMAAGASRHLTFKVKINQPNFNVQTGLPPLTIDNVGAIVSGETASTPSNHVITKVVAVLGVKIVRKPRKLPFTGMPTQEAMALAMLMIGAGVVLTTVRRRREQ